MSVIIAIRFLFQFFAGLNHVIVMCYLVETCMRKKHEKDVYLCFTVIFGGCPGGYCME